MTQKFSNGARGELASTINSTDATISIVEFGNLFPVANTGNVAISGAADWFKAVLQDADGIEIVYVRTHTLASNTFSNVIRGQEGTIAREFVGGSVIGIRPLASDIAEALLPADWTTLQNKPVVVASGADQAAARSSIGLSNVNNTADTDKPISTATQTALDAKLATVSAVPVIEIFKIVGSGAGASVFGTASVTIGAQVPGAPTGVLWTAGQLTLAISMTNRGTIYIVNSDGTKSIYAAALATISGKTTFNRIIVPLYTGNTLLYIVENGVAASSGNAYTLYSNDTTNMVHGSAVLATAIGALGTLTTTDQTSLVAAVNEVKAAKANLTANTFTGNQAAPVFNANVLAIGNSGTSKTINLALNQNHSITLNGNCTLTLSNPVAGAVYKIVITQDGTGNRLITWPSGIKWANATVAVLSTVGGSIDIVTLYYDGTTYFGQIGNNFL